MKRAALIVVLACGTAAAQTSASFKLTESRFNAGGDPRDGSFAASASWKIRLDAIGEDALAASASSGSWRMDAGFPAVYAPPGEVRNLRWPDRTTLAWDPERSVGAYEVYRDLVSTLPGGFGTCFASSLLGETATEAGSPAASTGWFYLVTARNRLGEEGTKGSRTGGIERPNSSPCP